VSLHYTGFPQQTIGLRRSLHQPSGRFGCGCDNPSPPTATIGHWRAGRPLPKLPKTPRRATQAALKGEKMSLIIVYLALLFVGQAAAVVIGLAVDTFSKVMGLFVFLALYFLVFAVCWKVAVRLTVPGSFLHARFGR
jgi:hypothetical protein